MKKYIKIAYIGGGSKQWARVFMSDLAVSEDLSGQIALYDLDLEAAHRNAAIGARINQNPAAKSHFDYIVCPRLEDALEGADFVIISILPGTFREMRSDVHAPEASAFTSLWAIPPVPAVFCGPCVPFLTMKNLPEKSGTSAPMPGC